jgi:hypothetical protein
MVKPVISVCVDFVGDISKLSHIAVKSVQAALFWSTADLNRELSSKKCVFVTWI